MKKKSFRLSDPYFALKREIKYLALDNGALFEKLGFALARLKKVEEKLDLLWDSSSPPINSDTDSSETH
jgi:hypothetical protein